MSKAMEIVDQQAEDEGLWFKPKYCTEDYLQIALRELHDAVEQDNPDWITNET